MTDKQLATAIREIIDRGHNAEVRKKSDGSLAVYEIRRKTIAKC